MMTVGDVLRHKRSPRFGIDPVALAIGMGLSPAACGLETQMSEMQQPRAIHEIAREIYRDWNTQPGKGINYAARPYLEAMFSLNKITDKYILDDGESIVLYFLSNAGTYKGEKAKLLKAELKALLPKRR